MVDLIAESLEEKGSEVVKANGDADVDIVLSAVGHSQKTSTTLVGEDTLLCSCIMLRRQMRGFTSDQTN